MFSNKKPSLVDFQVKGEDEFLPLFSDEYLKFNENQLNHWTWISILKPEKEEELHDKLELVLSDTDENNSLIVDKKVLFQITKLDVKLDFIGIRCCFAADSIKDCEDVYNAHTGCLFIRIQDRYGKDFEKLETLFLRNKNVPGQYISPDISVSEIIKSYNKSIIKLKHPIAYLPSEMIVYGKSNKEILPINEPGFPIKQIIIFLPIKEKLNLSNLKIKCEIFNKWYMPENTNKNIEFRKLKNTDSNCSAYDESDDPLKYGEQLAVAESSSRKHCFVISYNKYENPGKDRKTGTHKDLRRIKEIFFKLGYEIKIYKNQTTVQLKDNLSLNLNEIQDSSDIVFTFVLSHGEKDGFYTYDGMIEFLEFKKIYCENILKQIPKIILYQCCLGDKFNGEHPSNDNENIYFESPLKIQIENPTKKILPRYSNFFEGFSTVPEYKSCRDVTGSPYIQTVLDVFEENHTKYTITDPDSPPKDIREQMDEVQVRMAKQILEDSHFQIPSYTTCLIEKVYL